VPAVSEIPDMAPQDTYLSFRSLTEKYADLTALQSINGEIPAQNICGFIGPDGAGKSTLLRLIVGLGKPADGKIIFTAHGPEKPGSIGYMPQQFSMYPDLTVRENLLFFADLYHIKGSERKKRYERLLQFSRLTNFTDRKAENLSGGMKQKLALISVLMYAPPLLVLDEPTTGVDPIARSELWEMLHQLKQEGHTIIVSTPYMEEAVQCDLVTFMSGGEILSTNSPTQLVSDYQYDLYELRCEHPMDILPELERVDWIKLVYPKGDKLHLGVTGDALSQQLIDEKLTELLPEDFILKQISPEMEDVYAALETSV